MLDTEVDDAANLGHDAEPQHQLVPKIWSDHPPGVGASIASRGHVGISGGQSRPAFAALTYLILGVSAVL